MTLRDIPAETPAETETMGCSRVSVRRYAHRWNEQGMEAAKDHMGGNNSSFTEDMPTDIDDAVRSQLQCGGHAGCARRPRSHHRSGAVATRHVRPYAMVGGVPARVISMRLDEQLIRMLLDVAWWNLTIEDLKSMKDMFVSGDDPRRFLYQGVDG